MEMTWYYSNISSTCFFRDKGDWENFLEFNLAYDNLITSCPKGLGSPFKGRTPFFIIFMKELSVFVDEAGVFGLYDYRNLQ